jgi:hydrogenase-4 component E
VPVGIAVVLYGMLVLATRRHAISQLLGFLMLDNGIATVAFLTAGGVPLVVELGVSLDVLLVVLILQVLTSHIRTEFGEADLDDLAELRD